MILRSELVMNIASLPEVTGIIYFLKLLIVSIWVSNLPQEVAILCNHPRLKTMEREVLEKMQRILGDEHPGTLSAMSKLPRLGQCSQWVGRLA